MIEDAQRAKLFRAEEEIWDEERDISREEVVNLVAEFNRAFRRHVEVEFIEGDGHIKLFRGKLWLPAWAMRFVPIVHELTHTLISPIFPTHGAEFAARELEVLQALYGPVLAEHLRLAFERNHVHFDVKKRQQRCRRVIVNYANRQPGKLLEVVLDGPPELVVGSVGERVDNAVHVGDELVDFERLRYVNGIAAATDNER